MKYFHMYEKRQRLTFSLRYYSLLILYLPFLLRETPDQFFERPEHNQSRILVTGVGFTGYYMLVDEMHLSCESRKYSHLPMYRFHISIRSYDSTTLCFQCYLFQINRRNNDIISTAVPRNPWFPENTTKRSLVNMQNKKRHVIILFLKSITTGQSSKKF